MLFLRSHNQKKTHLKKLDGKKQNVFLLNMLPNLYETSEIWNTTETSVNQTSLSDLILSIQRLSVTLYYLWNRMKLWATLQTEIDLVVKAAAASTEGQDSKILCFFKIWVQKLCLICADISPDLDHKMIDHVIMNIGLILAMYWCFFTITQLLSSPDDGLEWCGLLWCFYQTLILTAPIHCNASVAETLMQCYISPNLIYILDNLRGSRLSFWGELFL